MDADFLSAEFLCYQCDQFGNSGSCFRDSDHFTEANGYSAEQISALAALEPSQSIDMTHEDIGGAYFIMRVN